MPEIKHNFTSGKMNKDLDERLVPNGQYRDAMNIQVLSSEDSNVGTIQNILGNTEGCNIQPVTPNQGAKTVGSISDEKNDNLYWLISGQDYNPNNPLHGHGFYWEENLRLSDMIVRKRSDYSTTNMSSQSGVTTNCEYVLIDEYGIVISNDEIYAVDTMTFSSDFLNQLEVGMTVTGVSNYNSPTNTVTITNIDKTPKVDFTIGYNPGFVSGGGFLYDGVYVGLQEQTPPGSSTAVYVQTHELFIKQSSWSTLNLPINNSIGAEISIFGLTQPNTHIVTATAMNLAFTNGVGLDVIKITIDQPLNTPGPSQPPWTPWSLTVGMSSPAVANAMSDSYPTLNSGAPFQASLNWNLYSPNATINGNLQFTSADYWFLISLNIGDQILPNLQFPDLGSGYGGCISGIDLNTFTITIDDCSGTQLFPLSYWGNAGIIEVNTTLSGSVTFDSTLNFTNNQGNPNSEFLLFRRDRVLNFNHDNLITGINIVDDMLFWTDGITEPKKINIPNSIAGTTPVNICVSSACGATLNHTLLVNDEQNININTGILLREKHITVIRNSPKKALAVNIEKETLISNGTTGNSQTFLIDPNDPSTGNLTAGSVMTILLLKDPLQSTSLNIDDIILFNPSSNSSPPQEEHEISVVLQSQINDGANDLAATFPWYGQFVAATAGTYEVWEVKIVSISYLTSTNPQEYNWAVKLSEKQKFKNKFPRYSYRYKYNDGEYSTFAPFTNVIFEPRDFKYEPTEAYNLGMENQITKTVLSDYNINLPKDVVEIDLLYKESNSPTVYIIDTIRGNKLTLLNSTYEVKPSQIRSVLPENQLLRSWDNVPRTALAQEVTGNRIVYGNYLQNYTIDEDSSFLSANLVNRNNCDTTGTYKSLKSIRNYSLGLSYLDKYGRQSPVFTNKQSDFQIPINKSKEQNQISTNIVGSIPEWATHYKVFVKETSNEYYNLAMDRLYDAEDGNVWLSFPSSDRNKVDEESFLILKKGVEGADPVSDSNKYKVIAIENEAPDFIKTRIQNIGEVDEDNVTYGPSGTAVYFTSSGGYPIKTKKKIILKKSKWDEVGLPLDDFEKLQVRITTQVGSVKQLTAPYDVVSFTSEEAPADQYTLILDRPIEEEWTTPDSSNPDPYAGIMIYEKQVINSPQFDGRFFVKVTNDINISTYIISQAIENIEETHSVVTSLDFHYIADTGSNNASTVSGLSSGGGTIGSASNTWEDWATIYGSDAMNNSGWFIDSAYYAGYYPESAASFLNEEGMLPPVNNSTSHPGYPTTKVSALIPETSTSGYHKGIWKDSNGQVWMDLSFGQIQSSKYNASSYQENDFQLHTSANFPTIFGDQASYAQWCMPLQNVYCPSGNTYCENGCSDDQHSYSLVAEAYYEGLYDWDDKDDLLKHWRLGSHTTNPAHKDEKSVILQLKKNKKFKFSGDTNATIYTITDAPIIRYTLSHMSPNDVSVNITQPWGTSNQAWEAIFDELEKFGHSRNRRLTYRIPIDKDPTDPSVSPAFNPVDGSVANHNTSSTIQFVEDVFVNINDQEIPENPAIWETEPKEDVGLDIYHEVDSAFPLEINNETNYTFAPIGSIVSTNALTEIVPPNTTVVAWNGNVVQLSNQANDSVFAGQDLTITFSRPDGSCVKAKILSLLPPFENISSDNFTYFLKIDKDVSKQLVNLSWFNCYSFNNGVESNRIRDDYNQVVIDKGPKASTTLSEPYKQEIRKHGLIYSGLYNSTSGVNNLNQFIAAEKITKDINPIYGSIQKLHTRDTDLITLCEDKILQILANKDAVFNADGNANLVATDKVLGNTRAFVGEYGISKNPESFASESYRAYFTDKVRGVVIRLSKDGLTPISDHGMKDWFRDNLKLNEEIIGSYDDKKGEYNVTLTQTTEQVSKSVSFKENVKGWVSFKSFCPENGISCANEYYTFKNGRLWKHHDEIVDRNTFYDEGCSTFVPSKFTVILNELPESIKSFKTINYEGSQAKVNKTLDDDGFLEQDGEYFNLYEKEGWSVNTFITNLERGGITDFIEKEGKWFGHIIGEDVEISSTTGIVANNFDTSDFSTQGIGLVKTVTTTSLYGCTDPQAYNYNPNATIDDNSCIAAVLGCTDPAASNYNSQANTDNNSCVFPGCTDSTAVNYDPNANTDDGSCIDMIIGCTLAAAFNYDPTANTSCGGDNILNAGDATGQPLNYCCEAVVYGCMDGNTYGLQGYIASNYDPNVNTSDNSCLYFGCTDPNAQNYTFVDPNTGLPTTPQVTADGDPYLQGIAMDDGSCGFHGCMDPVATNYDPNATFNTGCTYEGCATYNTATGGDTCNITSGTFQNTTWYATIDDGSCQYCNKPDTNIPASVDTSNPQNPIVSIQWYNTSVNVDVIDASGYEYFWLQLRNISANENWTASYWPNFSGAISSYPDRNFLLSNTTVNIVGTVWTEILNIASNGDNWEYRIMQIGDYGPNGPNATCISSWSDIQSFTEPNEGCTDPNAFNYDANATLDDGSCIPVVLGCIDPLAGNYNPSANVDDGSCVPIALGCTDSNAFNYDAAANSDDGSCCYISGCTDSNFNNFDPNACWDDGSCFTYIYGCTDPNAFNYDPNANTDDGTCYPFIYGCMDPTATNYDQLTNTNQDVNTPCNSTNPDAPTYDGSSTYSTANDNDCCIPFIYGCTDTSAFNYNALANTDDGSCCLISGCTDPNAFNYDANACNDDGSCIGVVLGCTDTNACNYNSTANTDDGSCGYTYGCTDPTQFNYDPNATCDDGSCAPFQYGCTDPTAFNYNVNVNTDDGSCVYPGCTDPTALNYDPNSNLDDGTCILPVPGCMDPSAITVGFTDGGGNSMSGWYDANYNVDCNGNDPGTGNYGDTDCCCMPSWFNTNNYIPALSAIQTPTVIVGDGCDNCTGGDGQATPGVHYEGMQITFDNPPFNYDWIQVKYKREGGGWSVPWGGSGTTIGLHNNDGTDANIINNGTTTTFTFYPLGNAGCTDTVYAASNPGLCSGSYADGDKWTTSDNVEHFGFHALEQDSGAKYIFYIRFYVSACETNTLGYQPGSYTIANGTVTLV